MEEIAILIVATLQGEMMLLTHTHASTLTLTLIIPDPQENDNSDISGHVGTERQRGKYREKKKARTAYLEDEVKRLQSLNEYLLRKLQSQRMVETEIIKLRALLVEMQVKIDDELGVFSFQKQCNGSGFVFKEGDVSLLSVCVGYIYDIGDK
uniref:BZIP domain-containing protein n=1 Tax=Brassica campestris TaxID=3711 RepID=M4CRP5_BRACM